MSTHIQNNVKLSKVLSIAIYCEDFHSKSYNRKHENQSTEHKSYKCWAAQTVHFMWTGTGACVAYKWKKNVFEKSQELLIGVVMNGNCLLVTQQIRVEWRDYKNI